MAECAPRATDEDVALWRLPKDGWVVVAAADDRLCVCAPHADWFVRPQWQRRGKKEKGNQGVLATRNPMTVPGPPGVPTLRADERTSSAPATQLPPRITRYVAFTRPVGFVRAFPG